MIGSLNTDNERQIVSDYRDYQKIDDFYSIVKSRNCYLLLFSESIIGGSTLYVISD